MLVKTDSNVIYSLSIDFLTKFFQTGPNQPCGPVLSDPVWCGPVRFGAVQKNSVTKLMRQLFNKYRSQWLGHYCCLNIFLKIFEFMQNFILSQSYF
jgi:hypothetical protein